MLYQLKGIYEGDGIHFFYEMKTEKLTIGKEEAFKYSKNIKYHDYSCDEFNKEEDQFMRRETYMYYMIMTKFSSQPWQQKMYYKDEIPF